MVSENFIRVIYNEEQNESGRKLKVNIEPIQRNKGINTVDIPLPTLDSDERILIPTSGLIDDIRISIKLVEETDDVAFDVSASGFETARSDVKTIKEQWDFLFDEIVSSNVFSIYELYLDWNGQTYKGWLQTQSSINNLEYSGQIEAVLIFKVGKNPVPFAS